MLILLTLVHKEFYNTSVLYKNTLLLLTVKSAYCVSFWSVYHWKIICWLKTFFLNIFFPLQASGPLRLQAWWNSHLANVREKSASYYSRVVGRATRWMEEGVKNINIRLSIYNIKIWICKRDFKMYICITYLNYVLCTYTLESYH